MKHDKAEEKESAQADERTPFERFEDFARRVLAVPKSELNKQERAYQRRRSKRP